MFTMSPMETKIEMASMSTVLGQLPPHYNYKILKDMHRVAAKSSVLIITSSHQLLIIIDIGSHVVQWKPWHLTSGLHPTWVQELLLLVSLSPNQGVEEIYVSGQLQLDGSSCLECSMEDPWKKMNAISCWPPQGPFTQSLNSGLLNTFLLTHVLETKNSNWDGW
jgi:hypothetical protein